MRISNVVVLTRHSARGVMKSEVGSDEFNICIDNSSKSIPIFAYLNNISKPGIKLTKEYYPHLLHATRKAIRKLTNANRKDYKNINVNIETIRADLGCERTFATSCIIQRLTLNTQQIPAKIIGIALENISNENPLREIDPIVSSGPLNIIYGESKRVDWSSDSFDFINNYMRLLRSSIRVESVDDVVKYEKSLNLISNAIGMYSVSYKHLHERYQNNNPFGPIFTRELVETAHKYLGLNHYYKKDVSEKYAHLPLEFIDSHIKNTNQSNGNIIQLLSHDTFISKILIALELYNNYGDLSVCPLYSLIFVADKNHIVIGKLFLTYKNNKDYHLSVFKYKTIKIMLINEWNILLNKISITFNQERERLNAVLDALPKKIEEIHVMH